MVDMRGKIELNNKVYSEQVLECLMKTEKFKSTVTIPFQNADDFKNGALQSEIDFACQLLDEIGDNVFLVPVQYTVMGYIPVLGVNIDNAVCYAKEHVSELSLPKNPEYLEESFVICDTVDDLEVAEMLTEKTLRV